MREPAWWGRESLRWRLPALIFALLAMLGGAFAWLAYAEVQRALRTSGTERLTAAARQVASLLAQSAKARLAEATRIAADPGIRRALLAETEDTSGAQMAAVRALAARNPLTSVLIYDGEGQLLRRVGGAGEQAATTIAQSAPPVGVSPLVSEAGRVWYFTTVEVQHASAGDPKLVSVQRALGSAQAADLIERLIGREAVLKFGNASGDLWTDLSEATSAPPMVAPYAATQYTSETGEPFIGVAVPVPDAPWLVWVAADEETMLAASRRLIRQMVPLTVVLMIFGAFPVYWVSGRITKPLEALAHAAEAIAAGDYTRRVEVERQDEIGRLGNAFNVMAGRVQADRELLEQRVAERTRELEAFSYSVSHDLRAPLRHIAGFAALLEKHASTQLDEQGRRYVDTISEAARHMGRLVDDLLGFSRMARADMLHGQVNLRALVDDVIKEVTRESPERTVVWTVGTLPTITGDQAMLRLALMNLIQNAYKYTSKRAVGRIEIGATAGADGERILYVKDNGVGFDMTYAAKLFGVFQRLHNVEDFEGTGIGLASVRRIVERHGGRTWAEGTVDAGATFYVAFPAEPVRATS